MMKIDIVNVLQQIQNAKENYETVIFYLLVSKQYDIERKEEKTLSYRRSCISAIKFYNTDTDSMQSHKTPQL